MLLVISGLPGAFISAFFAGSLLIEQVFSLDGLGLLTYKSIQQRDYPVLMGIGTIVALLTLIYLTVAILPWTALFLSR